MIWALALTFSNVSRSCFRRTMRFLPGLAGSSAMWCTSEVYCPMHEAGTPASVAKAMSLWRCITLSDTTRVLRPPCQNRLMKVTMRSFRSRSCVRHLMRLPWVDPHSFIRVLYVTTYTFIVKADASLVTRMGPRCQKKTFSPPSLRWASRRDRGGSVKGKGRLPGRRTGSRPCGPRRR